MDPQRLGAFIAKRRKELDLTQAELSQKLHVTDKAVSRWERGVGLPDINLLEPLAQALDISLVELVQAQRMQRQVISLQEADQIVADTVRLSEKHTERRIVGIGVLGLFSIICLLLLGMLIRSGSIVAYSVGSITAGLVAWGAPIWQMTLAKKANAAIPGLISLSAALTSVAIQFFQLANDVETRDFAAIEDTIHALCLVVVTFSMITLILNLWMIWCNRRR